MSGQNVTVAQEASECGSFRLSGALFATIPVFIPLYIAEKRVVVEDFECRMANLDATATSLTVKLTKRPNGAATDTDITATALLGTVNGAGLANRAQSPAFVKDRVGVPSENIVEASEVIGLLFSGVPTAAQPFLFSWALRLTERIA
jgi:hypothetical protein